jgi:hypothetical protein
MATVEVTFTPLPAHVRTARLVATAVARRSGVAESLLDEVRLAVGEACSRAVEAHQLLCPAEPVRIALTDQPGRFEIEVINTNSAQASAQAVHAGPDPVRQRSLDGAEAVAGAAAGPAVGPAAGPASGPAGAAGTGEPTSAGPEATTGRDEPDVGLAAAPGPEGAVMPPGFSLAVIAGLADDVQISETSAGTSIRMSWPSSGSLTNGSPL